MDLNNFSGFSLRSPLCPHTLLSAVCADHRVQCIHCKLGYTTRVGGGGGGGGGTRKSCLIDIGTI